MDCLFCKINKNEVDSLTIYEDEIVKVILDAYPDANGHTLIIPKKHITDMDEMDNETLSYINDVAKRIRKVLFKALNPEGMVFIVNYGSTQMIKHYHLHLIPVYKEKQKNIDRNLIYQEIMKAKESI